MISTVDHSRAPLLEALVSQAYTPHLRFYMPGHKGGKGSPASLLQAFGSQILQADIPELPGLDQLAAPHSVIRDAQLLAADAFGAEQTWFLVNGSSVGLMAALLSLCHPGEQVILPRNCHQSIVHGLILSGAHPVWICPPYDPQTDLAGCLTPKQLEAALEQYPLAKAAIAVSPTYEGICGNIRGLATIAHGHHIPLIVDEAHGAHFGFHPDLPDSALSQGADVVVQSTHKVLGALSQASMLHVQGDRINRQRIQTSLTLLQSSSPNYLLLASLDSARQQMATQGFEILSSALEQAHHLRARLNGIIGMTCLSPTYPPIVLEERKPIDPLRLTLLIQTETSSGFELDEWLTAHNTLIAEFPKLKSLTFVLGQGNSSNDLDQLYDALKTFSDTHFKVQEEFSTLKPIPFFQDSLSEIGLSPLSPREAFYGKPETTPLSQAIGQISYALLCAYPPGIPILFPGEIITTAAVEALLQIQKFGGSLVGLRDSSLQTLETISPI